MKYRRRQRWLRRLAVGLAFASFAAPAAARPDEGGVWKQHDPAIAAAIVAEGSEFVPGVTDFPYISSPGKQSEPVVVPYLSHGVGVGSIDATAVRPDDRGDRFVHSDVAPRAELASSGGWELDRDAAVATGIGALALVLGLGLGLALGTRRRTSLAGH